MSILVYSNSDDQTVNKYLLELIESRVPRDQMEFLQTFEALKERVHRLSKEIDVAVLLAKDNVQLCELVSLKDFLEGVRIILILPDQGKETVSKATKLFPNFISSMDSDFHLVSDVLERMLKNRNTTTNIGARGTHD
jgi:hypothetical protein